jgi:hypothetical protein
VLACVGLIAITWLDMLDLVETLVLLEHGGYGEANLVAAVEGSLSILMIKLVVPILIGLLLLLTYRRSQRLFRLVTLVLWLAIVPYAAVVTHNLQLLLSR